VTNPNALPTSCAAKDFWLPVAEPETAPAHGLAHPQDYGACQSHKSRLRVAWFSCYLLRNIVKVQRISLEHIAKVAGVHKATVSRALRNHPTIPQSTRERIQLIAKELGYRPNPLVSIFQQQARSGRVEKFRASLGWFNDYPNEACWRDFPWLRGYHEGARMRCESMGYRLHQIHAAPDGMRPKESMVRISRELSKHGIYGMILPLVLNGQYLQNRWKDCAISMIGGAHREAGHDGADIASMLYPQGFPCAERDLFFNARLAFQKVLALGYSRIGFVYSKYLDDEAQGRTRAGFLIEQESLPASSRIPILFLERFKEGRPVEFDAWFHRYMPDGIICVNPAVRSWIEGMGLSVPGDVGLANLNVVDDVADWSGINENHAAVGAAAVDLIISALSRNEIGTPPEPRKILVPGSWIAGSTLRNSTDA
jgi:LacI family transcriptional regulator